jgi:hypothetical protein
MVARISASSPCLWALKGVLAFTIHYCRWKRATDCVVEHKTGIAKRFDRRFGDESDAVETIEQLPLHPHAIVRRLGRRLIEAR